MLALFMSAPGFSAPTPITTQFPNDEVLATLPAQLTDAASPPDARALAEQVREYLASARATGDPRYLGYAQRLLQACPPSRMDDRLLVLRATLRQSLHRFDEARVDLEQVLANRTDPLQRSQALLTLANLELVQGHYGAAKSACQQLHDLRPGLIAASCGAQVAARTGQATTAYEALQARIRQSRIPPDHTSRAWAQGTLADIAAQLGRPVAEAHWRRTLALAPDDLYSRAQLADWLINQGRHQEAIDLTEGYDAVDTLAVLRAIALKARAAPEAEALIQSLDERFAEARWRGNLLHQRDYARYLLDLRQQPEQALAHARTNWQDQREPLDTRLLLRAALASNDAATLSTTRQWLADHRQHDARFPEDQP